MGAGSYADDGESLFFKKRRKEVFRILGNRIGSGVDLPDCDDSLAAIEVLADTFRLQHDASGAAFWLRRIVDRRAPWLSDFDFDAIVAAASDDRRMSQRAIGIALGLRAAERAAWGIETIAAGDLTREESQALAKERKRARDRARAASRRRNAGAVSRDEFLAASLTSERPWEAEGVCRRTWERRRRGETRDDAGASRPSKREEGGDGPATRGVSLSPWVEAGVSRATFYRRKSATAPRPGEPRPGRVRSSRTAIGD